MDCKNNEKLATVEVSTQISAQGVYQGSDGEGNATVQIGKQKQ